MFSGVLHRPTDLRNVLLLREIISNMKVQCDFKENGCSKIIRLMDLMQHTQGCEFRLVACKNNGCVTRVCSKDLARHETEDCQFRPLGICQKGCGLVVLNSLESDHDCVQALKSIVTEKESSIHNLKQEIMRLSHQFSDREASLVNQLKMLQKEPQAQSAKSERTMTERKKSFPAYTNCHQQCGEDQRVTVMLERQNGTLGFNIMGGFTQENNNNNNNNTKKGMEMEGIIVSKVVEGGPAEKNGLHTHDQIVKVNGQDLSQATHEEAVEAFRTAREPIVVEVLRRVNSNKTSSSKMRSRSPTMVSIGTQTDEDIYGFDRPPTPPPAFYPFYNSGLFQPASRRPVVFSPSTEMGLTDIEMAQNYDCDDPYFDDHQYDMEYEEVTLQCQNTEEKLGLTLCYGSAEDGVTDIFIGEIEPYSITAKDGRIREGDQIIQINGVDVHSRDQVIQLFSDRGSEITLLVARPQLQFDDGFMEEHNMVLDALQMDILEKHHHDNMQIMASMLARGHHFDEEGGTTDTGTTENSSHKHEKDSGVGRTDESTKNDESSEQEAFDTECTSSPANTKLRSHANSSEVHYCRINQSSEAHYSSFNQSDALYSNDSVISNDPRDSHDFTENDIPAVECEKFREALKHCCDNNRPEKLNSPKLNSRKDSESSLDRELALLNKEMENIQLECQEIVDSHIRDRNKVQPSPKDSSKSDTYRTPRSVPRMGTRLEYVKHAILSESPEHWARKENQPSPKTVQQSPQGKSSDKEKDASTTSAYNSGESCRSTPLPVTLELNQTSDEGDKGFKNSMLCLAPPDISSAPSLSDTEKQTQTPSQLRQCSGSENNKPDANHSSTEQKEELPAKVGMGESLQDLYMQYADVMYTNKANLQHTIQIQQKLFQQQLDQRTRLRGAGDRKQQSQQLTSSPKRSGSTAGHNSDSPSQNVTPPDSSVQMEWVVKRRPDGSRYITRRPVRNKLLKERAKKINEERCGMTTDDDAMSELKTGRYWTKEERKRHLEKARDHKKRRELMIKAKMETLKEADEKKELNILELSHRKMMKHKGKRVLDDFTTVQEMLAHGSRGGDGKNYHPLLSVTTV